MQILLQVYALHYARAFAWQGSHMRAMPDGNSCLCGEREGRVMSEQKLIPKQVRLNLFGALKGLDCNRFI